MKQEQPEIERLLQDLQSPEDFKRKAAAEDLRPFRWSDERVLVALEKVANSDNNKYVAAAARQTLEHPREPVRPAQDSHPLAILGWLLISSAGVASFFLYANDLAGAESNIGWGFVIVAVLLGFSLVGDPKSKK